MIQTVYVVPDEFHDALGAELLAEVRATLGITSTRLIRSAKVYRLEGVDIATAERLARDLLADVGETYRLNDAPHSDAAQRVEVAYLPGVMNPETASIEKAARQLGVDGLWAADSAHSYAFYGTPTVAELDTIVRRLLVNPTVEQRVTQPPTTLRPQGEQPPIAIIPVRSLDDPGLMALSGDTLFLDLAEMRAIRDHFAMLGRDPTDGELETLAQTWSEHCVHKTFSAPLVVEGRQRPSLFSRLKEGSQRHPRGVVSSFVDNSGVIELYDGWSICGKVETHNSPAAIEPYGGAMTGTGGVFRDIVGTGRGARVVASTDMFCLAPPDLPDDRVPPGCLAPRYLLRRIVAGVRDYGNRTGIPTCNGSVHFHPDFRAKPSVIVGAYGVIRTELAPKGEPAPGDVVLALGGRTGRDGIHGATFASAPMTARTGTVNSSAVQIGNAIEEKRVFDAVIACRDRGLIRAVTDCGGGGFSSAVGEMGRHTGVRVDLSRAPLKYAGLAPWEIWVSESQERMVLAVHRDEVAAVIDVCSEHNVEATALGEFTGDGRLTVTMGEEILVDLDMDFLHGGVPLPERIAQRDSARLAPLARAASIPPKSVDEWNAIALAVLEHGDVCSKEPIVRMYDHNVQGGVALPPFVGPQHDGPTDAAVLIPVAGQRYGMVIAHGLHPLATRLDPRSGALLSIAEALANAAAIGAHRSDLALIDNFIWPAPDEHWLWALDQAVDACVDAMDALDVAFISGKDSLSSTYRWPSGERLDIPPVLCVSAFGRIPDVERTVSADLKSADATLLLLGTIDGDGLGASVLEQVAGDRVDAQRLIRAPRVDLDALRATLDLVAHLIHERSVTSCHDVSQGGLFSTLADMCMGGRLGVDLTIDSSFPLGMLFAESAGCFVVETSDPRRVSAAAAAREVSCQVLGRTTLTSAIRIQCSGQDLVHLDLATCRRTWQAPMRDVFRTPDEDHA